MKFKELFSEASSTNKYKMIITLDADSKESNTDSRDAFFKEIGFTRESPTKGLMLPRSTYFGEVDSEESAKKNIRLVWNALKKSGHAPTRIMGGKISEWKVISTDWD